MRNRLAWLLALGPLFAVAYFLRVGESSFYVFDPYSLALLLMALPFVSGRRLMLLLIGMMFFVTVSAVGLSATVVTFGDSRIDEFVIVCLRYVQLVVITYVAIMCGKNAAVPVKAFAPHLLLTAACIPLVVGIVLLQIRPESVLVFNRFSSYLSSPNNIGAFVCIAIPAVNYSLGVVRNPRARLIFWLVFYGFAMASLFYAGSNSGWLLCGISFAISMLARKGRFLRSLFVAAILVGAVASIALMLQDWLLSSEIVGLRNTGELIETFRYGDQFMDLGSGRLRQSLAMDAIHLYFSSPLTVLFGIGLGQSPMLIGAQYAANITAHDAFLVLLLEAGALGFLALVLVLASLLRLVRVKREAWPLVGGYLLAMQGTPHVYLPFLWASMSFALYLVCASVRENGQAVRPGRREGHAGRL